jgi:predicted enzyme related to lactoylglutathione lyase
MASHGFHGQFLWQELLADDPVAAAKFYTQVLPWKSQPFKPGSDYTLFVTHAGPAQKGTGAAVAGTGALSEQSRAAGTPAHWRSHIGSNDVDATVTKAVGLGARLIMPPLDLPDVGRNAVLADPQGAVFGVYRPANAASASAAAPGPGSFAWNELGTTDFAAAFDFYRALFGWEVQERLDMGPMGTYLIFGRNGVQEGGIFNSQGGRPSSWLPYVAHASAEEAVRLATSAGGRVAHGPADIPGGGRIAQIFDPQNVLFAVVAMSAAAEPAAQSVAKSVAKSAAKPKAKAAPGKPAAKVAKKAVKALPRQAAKKVAKNTAKKPAKKPARKTARKTARKAVSKTGKKGARKSAAKSTRRPARKPAARKVLRKAGSARKLPARKK